MRPKAAQPIFADKIAREGRTRCVAYRYSRPRENFLRHRPKDWLPSVRESPPYSETMELLSPTGSVHPFSHKKLSNEKTLSKVLRAKSPRACFAVGPQLIGVPVAQFALLQRPALAIGMYSYSALARGVMLR